MYSDVNDLGDDVMNELEYVLLKFGTGSVSNEYQLFDHPSSFKDLNTPRNPGPRVHSQSVLSFPLCVNDTKILLSAL